MPQTIQQKILLTLFQQSPSSAFKFLNCSKDARIQFLPLLSNECKCAHTNYNKLQSGFNIIIKKFFQLIPLLTLLDSLIISITSLLLFVLVQQLSVSGRLALWTRQCNCLVTLILIVLKSLQFTFIVLYKYGQRLTNIYYTQNYQNDVDYLAEFVYNNTFIQKLFLGGFPVYVLGHQEIVSKILRNIIATEVFSVFLIYYFCFCYQILKFGDSTTTPSVQYVECIFMGFLQGFALSFQADLLGTVSTEKRGQQMKIGFVVLYVAFVVIMALFKASVVAALILPFQAYFFAFFSKRMLQKVMVDDE
eukprot:TRINITY_DN105_c2_g1_i2.p1 TRINITY_DN105_c2_g1~~TRINITY_DN105_c2_g1_i2.p1  ORF type:complete len:305 (-),score=-3.01 TRINITY_DN105_c2_g1_i2:736-1650(-)